MVSQESLDKMTVAASTLGWRVPLPEAEWPKTFERDGKTFRQEHLTVAQRIHEVQCGEYRADDGDFLIVYNE